MKPIPTILINKAYNERDYKQQEEWQVPQEYYYYDGHDMSADNNRNRYPWIYFDGELIAGDDFGNINLAKEGNNMKNNLLVFGILSFFILLLIISFNNTYLDENLGCTLGNTNGNIQNNVDIITNGDFKYYADYKDHDHLYKKNITNGEEECISDYKFAYQMNLIDNNLYYISSSPGKIMRTNLKTKRTVKVNNDYATNLIVTDKYIFYILASYDDNWGKLYCTDLRGKHKSLLVNDVKAFAIDINENCIYYLDKNYGSINKYDFALKKTETIFDGYAFYIDCDTNNIYFTDSKQSLFSLDKQTGEIFCITDNKCGAVNINDNIVYYSNLDDYGAAYSTNIDGFDKEKLNSSSVSRIVVDNKVLYCCLIKPENAEEKYYAINIDKK